MGEWFLLPFSMQMIHLFSITWAAQKYVGNGVIFPLFGTNVCLEHLRNLDAIKNSSEMIFFNKKTWVTGEENTCQYFCTILKEKKKWVHLFLASLISQIQRNIFLLDNPVQVYWKKWLTLMERRKNVHWSYQEFVDIFNWISMKFPGTKRKNIAR